MVKETHGTERAAIFAPITEIVKSVRFHKHYVIVIEADDLTNLI